MATNITYLEQGSGPPLVFLHGIGLDAAGWQYQLDEFAGSYRTVAWNMPGYGGSTLLPRLNFPAYADCLHAFLQAHNLEQPILVGHSMGGMIVQEYVATWPAEARAVVLYATSPAFGRKDGEWQQQFIKARLGPLDEGKKMVDLAPAMARSLAGSKAQPAGLELAIRSIAAVSEETFRATMLCLLEFDRREVLGRISMPCLVLAAGEDTNAPPSMMEKMAAKIPGARYICLPELGHLAHLEDPAVFNAALWEFLKQLS